MTVLDLPRAIARPVPGTPSGAASWRFAARLAMREVRRRRGRTLLVMLLVLVPVAAMTIGDVLERTQDDSRAEIYQRRFGISDAAIDVSESDAATVAAIKGAVPDVRVVAYTDAFAFVRTASGTPSRTYLDFTDLPLDDSVTAGIVEVRSGRAPKSADEALIAPSVAKRFGIGLGGTLSLTRPRVDLRVVGIGRRTDNHSALVVVVGSFAGFPPLAYPSTSILIDAPSPLTPADIERLRATPVGAVVQFPTQDSNSNTTRNVAQTLAWGLVAGVLVLTVLGIIIAAAFATSARRQLVTLGQLSANGAGQRLLRRMMALQGSISGLLGGLAGVSLGGIVLVLGHGTVESALNRSTGPYAWKMLDVAIIVITSVVVATIAAYIPARTAARVPVLAALAGRRPLGAVPRRLAPIGVTLFGGGVGLMALAAIGSQTHPQGDGGLVVGSVSSHGDLYAGVAIIGGLGILFGACCLSPVIVGWLGPIGARLRGSPKLAARSMARQRGRSAAVVTAIAAAGALSIAFGSYAERVMVQQASDQRNLGQPLNEVEVSGDVETAIPDGATVFDAPMPVVPDLDPARAGIKRIMPGATLTPTYAGVFDPAPQNLDSAVPFDPVDFVLASGRVGIADPAWIARVGLGPADQAQLAEVGALALVLGGLEDAPAIATVTLDAQPVDVTFKAARLVGQLRNFQDYVVVTPKRAAELGLTVIESGFVAKSAVGLDKARRDALVELQERLVPTADAFTAASASRSQIFVSFAHVADPLPQTRIRLAIVGFALLFALMVVAVGLALSAAESRDERDVLTSMGAKPADLRRVAGMKALWLALAGGLLAVPTGYVPITVTISAAMSDRPSDIGAPFPWWVGGGIVLVIPLVAGLGAWLASFAAQTMRPVKMSSLSAD
jgi:putative ABC transport system permease protein